MKKSWLCFALAAAFITATANPLHAAKAKKQESEVDKALKDVYPDAKTQITGSHDVNGVTDDITAKITAIQQATRQTVESNASIQGTVEEVQSSADRIREAMELQAQTVTMITAAVDETALAADSMSSTITAIRSDTENVAKDIEQVEQGFGRFSEQIANFKASAKAFVGLAA